MKLLKLFTTSLILIVSTMISLACPADPSQTKTITLDGGAKKVVRLMGDEYGNYWKAVDNSGCFKRRKGLPYRYVVVNEAEEIQKAEVQRRKSIENANQTVGQTRVLSPKKAQNSTRTSLGFPCTKQDLRGDKRMLVILVNFMDKVFSSGNAGMYNDIFNATNYQSGKFSGSVKDYFLAQSNGLMNLQFDIVGPVTVSRNSAYYGEQTDMQTDAHAPEMVREAVNLVDEIVDFSVYDWDNDGIVEHLVVIYAGLNQAEGGSEDDIWAHKGTITSFCDHTFIRNYACASENRLINGSIKLNGIGTICHEISHCFGLPDTYDQTTGNYGTDRWDLMGIGVHNDNGYTPAGYTAYDKMFCLWQSPIILKNTQNVTQILPLSDGGDFYLIPNDGWSDEFFLLENRQQTGWDSKLPGHGMLITHVDFDEQLFDSNIVNRTGKIGNSTNNHERMGLVLADNDMTIDGSDYYRWLRCLQGDLYPCGNNNCLTNTSTPSAKLFHKNIDGTYLLSKPVKNIKENGDMTMSFTFTNDIAAQHICHLTDINGKIRVISDTEAKLLVNIKNNGNVDYSRTIGAFVYTKEDGNYRIQASRDTHMVSLAAGETKGCEFYFNELEDNTDYYVFLFYVKEENTTGWTQMETAYPFNLADRNRFNITMDEEGMLIKRNGSSVDITATFHNDNYRAYDRYIGLYTYFLLENGYTLQQPRAFVIGDIEPFGEKRLTFKLDNMAPDMFYSAFFFYYPYETSSWEQLSGPYLVNSHSRILLGDVNGDGQVTITDVTSMVKYILGFNIEFFYIYNADIDDNGEINISDVMSTVNIILGDNGGNGTGDTSQSFLVCPDSNHPHLIDLGLPSGTKWACCNVGAMKPEESGGFYAWGETEEKEEYNWNTYIHCDGTKETCHDLGPDISGTNYDVAHVKWSGNWRMPSKSEFQELLDNCTSEWTNLNGVDGRKFIGTNGNSIFFPAAGYRWLSDFTYAGSMGHFWSSTQGPSNSVGAYGLRFESGYASYYNGSRHFGQSIRPVVKK